MSKHFASDNYAGICPQALERLLEANQGHEPAYGEDRWTREACDRLREIFQTDCEVFFVFNGTAANSLAVSAMAKSYHSLICHQVSHLETDECGAPEFFSHGSKILLAGGQNGKLTPEAVEEVVTRRTDIHFPKPRILSVTQATEVGTVYTPDELDALSAVCARHDLKFHMDGARFANALIFLGVSPKALSWKCGLDVLCLGGTKNGLPAGEAVIFFTKDLAADFEYHCKQAGQLASKMRFLSAPWLGLLDNNVWLTNAEQANASAALLHSLLAGLPGVEILHPREANSVFVRFPPGVANRLHELGWSFYSFIGQGGARLMCSWDTSEDTVRAFARDVGAVLAEPPA